MRFLVCLLMVVASGCASYTVPGRPADLSVFTGGQDLEEPRGVDERPFEDLGIEQILARRPTVEFPTGLAVVRVQAPDYESHTVRSGRGAGAYTVLTDREIEREADFRRLRELDRVVGVAPVNRLLVPEELRTDLELRKVAARLHADILLVYTVETTFDRGDSHDALAVVSLGILPTEKLNVRSTASALLLDTRTGYLYATAEGTARETTRTSIWNSRDALDETRRETETEAFRKLVGEVATAWGGVVATYEPGNGVKTGP